MKLCVVFDDLASAYSAEVLIKHVAAGFACETQSFQFEELDPPAPGVAAARTASDADILVLALREDLMLPEHVQSWLGMCMAFRDEDQEGALVLLVAKDGERADPNSSLFAYLETVAAIGGLAFFARHRTMQLTQVINTRLAAPPLLFRSNQFHDGFRLNGRNRHNPNYSVGDKAADSQALPGDRS